MNEYDLIPMFFTPVYKTNIGQFNKPDYKNIPLERKNSFNTSTNCYILEMEEYSLLKEKILYEIERYVRNVLCVSHNINFHITNSWLNRNDKGDKLDLHLHDNSLLSGVLYLEASNSGSNIVFVKEISSNIPFPTTLNLDIESHNLCNSREWSLTVLDNDLILFPSGLQHYVGPNLTDAPRYCLAFNVFISGQFGTTHKLSL